MKISSVIPCLAAMLLMQNTFAQQQKTTPYLPTQQEVLQSFKKANELDTALKNISVVTNITPNWQADGNSFWYRKPLDNREAEYYLVDAATGKKQLAFDHERLAKAITKLTDRKTDAQKLWINELFYSDDKSSITFKTGNDWFKIDLKNYKAEKATKPDQQAYNPNRPLQHRRYRWGGFNTDSVSPDKQWTAMQKKGNLVIKNAKTGNEITLSTDGTTEAPYGEFTWSPDGQYVVGYHINYKKIKDVYYVLSSVPGTTRGQLRTRDYAQPGDDFTSYEPFIFNTKTKKQLKIEADKIDFFGAPELHFREGNSRYFTFEKVDRGHQRFRLIEVDGQTGKTRNIIDERTKTFIYEQRIFTYYLPKTNEAVWVTEQDGWRHAYLVNTITGKQQLITKGNWVLRDIDSVDIQKRQLWFKGSGMNAGEDPYFIHYYRIGFNGRGLIDLTPEKGNHQVTYSPDRKYMIDAYSQVDVAPVVSLRSTATGKKIADIEKPDLAKLLATGIKLPEVFVAKARDGKTDIWGVIYRPANMDPNKAYPVIENIYAGPQDSFVPKNFAAVNEMQSIAQLGFIVVQIDGMGTANRSKAFHDVCWHNLADAGFPDRILWMKALNAKYPQADIDRVGLYGTSAGGQNAAGGLLFHPEFYKAGVAACGCHDNRIDKQWWNEQWMGYPVGPHYGAQSNITNAAKLQGNLMLIVGEADENVPPESTLRFADELIKANKDFDLLVIPGMGHSDGGVYGRRSKKNFFIKHLLKAESPVRGAEGI
ncbi:prolyl oligopeptidase family serine peptidase [Mucilaginibacter sp. UR6-1]|uniref:S9 family peptidase n=1 Tax=Mucilaginibacter sp. UR6-1 TaxID=1435643 RepID=UPI001E58DECB|nr:prolyl oligopeptidase family serine peptidase [Mucilaginibacter sp. UR6-1]MCC8408695.1 prolyl oligopeptidase family serine peptidase [Mucilaginibacter sp. UR6-1]